MTVYKNMAFGAKMQKVPKDEIDRRVSRVAELLGISHLLKSYPKALSGGQKQRVAIGSAPKYALICVAVVTAWLNSGINFSYVSYREERSSLLMIANLVFATIILLPLLYAVSVAFMPSDQLFTTEFNLFPKHITFNNFKEALVKIPLLRFVGNSFLVAGLITIGQIISCSLAAFSFSFLEFKGKNILFMIVMATMMMPGEATIISNYLIDGWLDVISYAQKLKINALHPAGYLLQDKRLEK